MVSTSQLESEFKIGFCGRGLASHLNAVFAASDSMPSYGVVAAGGIGYVYKGKTIDLMGLNNPEMAHANKVKVTGVKNHGSFSKKVFYKQNVDVFLSWPDPLTDNLNQTDSAALAFLKQLREPQYFINRVCANIFNDQEFNERYSFCRISNGARHFYGFVKRDWFLSSHPRLQVARLDLPSDSVLLTRKL